MSATEDAKWMARALALAERGRYSTSPNPRVGCVIVRDDRCLAEGWHIRAGEGHAEVNALAALAKAGETAAGATVYVTLEPCSHHGRTPPCAEALVKAKPSRVVVAMQDPNPLVAGRGIQCLSDAGIEVLCGVLENEAKALNRGFIRRMEGGLPWLTVKSAMSLDGRTAMASGESQWITGPAARADVQRLRAASCAILTGVETVLRDDAALTVRPASFVEDYDGEPWRQPLRVVLDTQLRTPASAKLLQEGGPVLIATASIDSERRDALQAASKVALRFLDLPSVNEGLDATSVVKALASEGCNEILVEAGAQVAGSVLRAGLVDDWYVYMAPCVMGSAGRPLVSLPIQEMVDKQLLNIVDIRAVGEDWRIHCRPVAPANTDESEA